MTTFVRSITSRTATWRRCGAAMLAAASLLAAAAQPARAAVARTDLLSGSNWLASPDGINNWIPAYGRFPNPVTMPNPFLNPDGIHGDLMWYWPGPAAPGPSSGPTTAFFRRTLDLPGPDVPQIIALAAADDQMSLRVNGVLIDTYALSDHKMANGQPEVVKMDLTPALHIGSNRIDIEAHDVGTYHWVYFDSYNIGAETKDVLVPLSRAEVSLIGDKDNFHGGDAADVTPRSPHVLEMQAALVRAPAVDLDQPTDNQSVGLTHSFTLPPGALITSATVKLHIQMTGDIVENDIILFNQSNVPASGPSSRAVELYDLLGFPPQHGAVYDMVWNLAKTPLRNFAPDFVSGLPDQIVNLLPMLAADGHLDVLVADDTMLDYSELTITYAMPGAVPGDLNNDGLINRDDVNILLLGLNTLASGPNDPRDLDHDGRITALDVRKLVASCTLPLCAR